MCIFITEVFFKRAIDYIRMEQIVSILLHDLKCYKSQTSYILEQQ